MLNFKPWLVRQYGAVTFKSTPKTETKSISTNPAKTQSSNS